MYLRNARLGDFALGELQPAQSTLTPPQASVPTLTAASTTLAQRLPPNPLDSRAQAIIAAANAPTPGIYGRAVSAVWSILRTYYPSEATKVSWVVYSESVPGLITTRMGTGPSATGGIRVGRYFIEHMNARSFARRVLQVGHELRHVDQYRAGVIDKARQPEREFLAHCWAVFAGERPGTGRMRHSMRVAIIDAALGYLNCLSAQVRERYRKHEERLRAVRATEQAASRGPATFPPSTCVSPP